MEITKLKEGSVYFKVVSSKQELLKLLKKWQYSCEIILTEKMCLVDVRRLPVEPEGIYFTWDYIRNERYYSTGTARRVLSEYRIKPHPKTVYYCNRKEDTLHADTVMFHITESMSFDVEVPFCLTLEQIERAQEKQFFNKYPFVNDFFLYPIGWYDGLVSIKEEIT